MEPILLAYLGIALMTGLTFIGSSYGVNGRKQPSLHSHPLSVRSRRGWEEQFQGM